LVEDEQRVLAVGLRLERHADLQQRVRGLLALLVLLEHLLELGDGLVPALLRVVRLAQPVLRVARQLVRLVLAEELVEELPRGAGIAGVQLLARAVGGRGRLLRAQVLLQRVEPGAHLLPLLPRGHAGGAEGERQKCGGGTAPSRHFGASTVTSARRFFDQAASSWPGSTARS